jgi:lysophospholipase L1-like esterase
MRRAVVPALMTLSSILVALVVAEVALRLAPEGSRLALESAPPAIEPPPPPSGRPPRRRPRQSALRNAWLYHPDVDPDVGFRLPESFETEHKGQVIRTNSLGFRGPELRNGTWRLVGIGDSIMFGWGVREEDTYLRQMERLLAPWHPDVETVNMAVPAYHTLQEVALLERHLPALRPAWVVVGFSDNDIKEAKPNLAGRPLLERRSHLYRLLRGRYLGMFPPRTWAQTVYGEFSRLAEISRAWGFRTLVYIHGGFVGPDTDPANLPHPDLRKICADEGLTVVNGHTVFVSARDRGIIHDSSDLWLSRTGNVDPHPTPEGLALIAEALAAAVRQAEGAPTPSPPAHAAAAPVD